MPRRGTFGLLAAVAVAPKVVVPAVAFDDESITGAEELRCKLGVIKELLEDQSDHHLVSDFFPVGAPLDLAPHSLRSIWSEGFAAGEDPSSIFRILGFGRLILTLDEAAIRFDEAV